VDGPEQAHERRKGRSNAIATYEMLAGLDNKLTRVVADVGSLKDAMRDRKEDFQDHEMRLRVIEAKQTAMDSSSSTSRGQWRDVWFGVIAVATLLLSATSTIVNILKGLHP